MKKHKDEQISKGFNSFKKGAVAKSFLAFLSAIVLASPVSKAVEVKDQFVPLPGIAVHFEGGLEDPIQNSIQHWNKGVVPYADFVKMFRTGRGNFAQGEMWGKAVRSGSMFYRYTQDPKLKTILQKTVSDLLTTKRTNGSISCSAVDQQPDSKGGDLWERKYVLLGLEGFYEDVEKDPAVLQAMIDEANCTIAQIGPPPKIRIVDQGWSRSSHIESSTILEPIMRLYNLTHDERYLDFARYIVEEGGAKGYNIFEGALNNTEPKQLGYPYPKAYEMMSLFEGLTEYYRVTGDERWKQAILNLYHNIRTNEITLIGNGGGPAVGGEGWDDTAKKQHIPGIKRMMETCVGVTWLKLCSQILRLTGDSSAMDEIEKYTYNGLIGAMKPTGDGFSYVNLLNGIKTNPEGWGGVIDKIYVTCCNLNGPMGLAYLPYVAVMQAETGPVVNLYNTATATASTPGKQSVGLKISTDYPKSGKVTITVLLKSPEKFSIKLRIPNWSLKTKAKVDGRLLDVVPGSYLDVARTWSAGDEITLELDMRCRLIDAPHGSNRLVNNFQALIKGPVVLARDENIDPNFNQPVTVVSRDGYVDVEPVPPTLPDVKMQFRVPTKDGYIQMVDYASVNSWAGKRVCTWLLTPDAADTK